MKVENFMVINTQSGRENAECRGRKVVNENVKERMEGNSPMEWHLIYSQ